MGWKAFHFLANNLRARVIFLRDPLHRLSNLFTRALKLEPIMLMYTQQLLIVHKFRRAPYGGGKFWKGLKEVLSKFLDQARPDHPLLELLGGAIAKDHGYASDAGVDVIQLARRMVSMPLGPKVQLRRWWTLYDAGRTLDRLWHTMLLALHIWYHAHGQDPEKVASSSTAVSEQDQDSYEMRVQTLLTLSNPVHHICLKSMLVAYRIPRDEHTRYTKGVADLAENLGHLQRWACWEACVYPRVTEALRSSLFGKRVWLDLGVFEDSDGEWGSVRPPAEEEGADYIIWLHWTSAMCMAAEMLAFATVPMSAPWCFCLLLQESTQVQALQHARRLFDLRNLLSQSAVPSHQVYLQSMPHLRWTVVSEVLGLLQAADWDLTTKHGRLADALV